MYTVISVHGGCTCVQFLPGLLWRALIPVNVLPSVCVHVCVALFMHVLRYSCMCTHICVVGEYAELVYLAIIMMLC